MARCDDGAAACQHSANASAGSLNRRPSVTSTADPSSPSTSRWSKEQVQAPSLYITGSNDRLVPAVDGERQTRETPLGEALILEGGSHVMSNMPRRARPFMADWMARHLASAK